MGQEVLSTFSDERVRPKSGGQGMRRNIKREGGKKANKRGRKREVKGRKEWRRGWWAIDK